MTMQYKRYPFIRNRPVAHWVLMSIILIIATALLILIMALLEMNVSRENEKRAVPLPSRANWCDVTIERQSRFLSASVMIGFDVSQSCQKGICRRIRNSAVGVCPPPRDGCIPLMSSDNSDCPSSFDSAPRVSVY